MQSVHRLWLVAEQALDRKEYGRAAQGYRSVLELDRGHVPALIGLSTALSRLNQHREAHMAALRAHDLAPPIAPLIYAVAQRLSYFHEFSRLLSCLADPEFARSAPPNIVAEAAVMLSTIGAHDEATKLVDSALARDSRCPAALHVRGNFHYFCGELEAAERCYEESLRYDPTLFQNALMLASVRTQTADRNHVDRLHAQLRRAKPGGTGEVYLLFALHKELHDLGRYTEAWDALARACAAKRRQITYSIQEHRSLVEVLTSVCSRGFVSAESRFASSVTPIFIVGMHRSGTTLLERMLSGHPKVADAGETSSFHAELELAADLAAPMGLNTALARTLAGADFSAVAKGYDQRSQWLSRGKPYFTEKRPQNFLNVGFIAKALPQARFLHLVRDPVDTCFSNLRTLFSGAALYSYDQRELGEFFCLYRKTMRHWHQILPGRVLDVDYDALVSRPEATARQVASHCGLEFAPEMLDIDRSDGSMATPSAAIARQGFIRNRGRAWRPYAEHLAELHLALANP